MNRRFVRDRFACLLLLAEVLDNGCGGREQ